MPTPIEKRIIQERKSKARGDVLVPILEELLEQECIPEDAEDFRFLDMLVRARALPRKKGVFSPSMLGSCLRQAYFAKRDVEKHMAASPQSNGYFLHGNFVHFKWQFAMWKAHRRGMLELVTVPIGHEVAIIWQLAVDKLISESAAKQWMDALNFFGDATRPGVEVRVVADDFGGTIDVLPRIDDIAYVTDFKGIRLDDYMKTVKRGAPLKYRKQIVGYAMNVNESDLGIQVDDCLLVSECKAGPVTGAGSPIALHEARVSVEEFTGEVTRRLRTLRWHDGKDDMPPPECKSTQWTSFQECPFNRFCLDEVRLLQREREKDARSKAGETKRTPRRVEG